MKFWRYMFKFFYIQHRLKKFEKTNVPYEITNILQGSAVWAVIYSHYLELIWMHHLIYRYSGSFSHRSSE